VSEESWQEQVAKSLLPLQIIVGALVAGCVVFLVIVLVAGGAAAGDAGNQRPLAVSYMALAFLGAAIAARCIMPGIVVRAGRRNIARGTYPCAQPENRQGESLSPGPPGDAGGLLTLFQTKTVMGAAIIEGVTFFMLIAYMVERWTPILAVAVVLILVIAAHMPTRSGVIHWIEDQLRLVEEERSLGR